MKIKLILVLAVGICGGWGNDVSAASDNQASGGKKIIMLEDIIKNNEKPIFKKIPAADQPLETQFNDSDFDYGIPVYGFAVAVKAGKDEFFQGEPVVVVVRIKNVVFKPIILSEVNPEREYHFSVVDSWRKPINKMPYQERLQQRDITGGMALRIKLAPNAYKDYRFDLSKRYDLSKPGKYIVQCRKEVFSVNAISQEMSWKNVYSQETEIVIK